ncbi:MAG: DUF4276 family protein [Deltaproteobacteria bacterium]|nr:DUF4276 family protein [Deltaproteobacteria bacterium]
MPSSWCGSARTAHVASKPGVAPRSTTSSAPLGGARACLGGTRGPPPAYRANPRTHAHSPRSRLPAIAASDLAHPARSATAELDTSVAPAHSGLPPSPRHRRRAATLSGPDRRERKRQDVGVIALTDVYTGRRELEDATDAKRKMHEWVGTQPRFFAHTAQHDFEAWLLPYWPRIQELAGHNRGAPPGLPEQVDHDKPPSRWIQEIFEAGRTRHSYVKPRDARRILEGQDLAVAARACQELRALLDRILTLCGASPLQ